MGKWYAEDSGWAHGVSKFSGIDINHPLNFSGTGAGATAGYEEALRLGLNPKFNQSWNLGIDARHGMTTIVTKSGARIAVASKTAAQWRGFFNDLEATGYYINPKYSGGYANRSMASGAPSQHQMANAVDINWFEAGNYFDRKGTNSLPPNVGPLADKWGISWGGYFKGRHDTMHFEVSRLLDEKAMSHHGALIRNAQISGYLLRHGHGGHSADQSMNIHGPVTVHTQARNAEEMHSGLREYLKHRRHTAAYDGGLR
jgi:hypothetical protein